MIPVGVSFALAFNEYLKLEYVLFAFIPGPIIALLIGKLIVMQHERGK